MSDYGRNVSIDEYTENNGMSMLYQKILDLYLSFEKITGSRYKFLRPGNIDSISPLYVILGGVYRPKIITKEKMFQFFNSFDTKVIFFNLNFTPQFHDSV